MTEPAGLLCKLLSYIEEQAKDIDPTNFRLSGAKGLVLRRADVVGLPGVDFDINVEGDHIWMRVARLEAHRPPQLPDDRVRSLGLIRIDSDPDGKPPSLDEPALSAWLVRVADGRRIDERPGIQARYRVVAEEALAAYAPMWEAWAAGEKPRRQTIRLYGDLFATKHQLESEETAKPSELVWGIGVTTWTLTFDGKAFPFEYPLLTQQLEIDLDEATMVLEIRPRATDTRFEADAFVECHVPGASEVDRVAREQLAKTKDRPVTPFDPGSYNDLLKLAAGNLDNHGSYKPSISDTERPDLPTDHLVVTDGWALVVRPRTNNFLIDDLHRLRAELEAGCEIPDGPGSLVTPASDDPVDFRTVNFRGLSSRVLKNPTRDA